LPTRKISAFCNSTRIAAIEPFAKLAISYS
jgi:hypothetical protein